MFQIVAQSGNTSAYVTEFVCDTEADIAELPTTVAPGSTCIVVNQSEVYMLNNSREWKKL